MKYKNLVLSLFLTFFLTLTILGVRSIPVSAQGGNTDFLGTCSTDNIDVDCKPPTLQQFEFLVVKLIYAAWGLGGFIWMGYFMFIVFTYFTGDQNKIEEAKKRLGRWFLGFVLFYLSWVIIANVMGVLIADGTDCFEEFNGTPGFKFFFPEVCEPAGP